MAGPRTSAGSPYIGAPPIKQKYPGHAVQAARIGAQRGASAYASKYVIVTDEDVDVTNLDHLLWAMLTRTDPKESIQFIAGSWDSFRPAMRPSPEVARRAKEKFGRLLDGRKRG